MNEGVQLMLKRMESHPEEFYENGRWEHITRLVRARVGGNKETTNGMDLPFLSDEEVSLLYDKWVSLQGPMFTDSVMRTILLEEAAEERGPVERVGTVRRTAPGVAATTVRSRANITRASK